MPKYDKKKKKEKEKISFFLPFVGRHDINSEPPQQDQKKRKGKKTDQTYFLCLWLPLMPMVKKNPKQREGGREEGKLE